MRRGVRPVPDEVAAVAVVQPQQPVFRRLRRPEPLQGGQRDQRERAGRVQRRLPHVAVAPAYADEQQQVRVEELAVRVVREPVPAEVAPPVEERQRAEAGGGRGGARGERLERGRRVRSVLFL